GQEVVLAEETPSLRMPHENVLGTRVLRLLGRHFPGKGAARFEVAVLRADRRVAVATRLRERRERRKGRKDQDPRGGVALGAVGDAAVERLRLPEAQVHLPVPGERAPRGHRAAEDAGSSAATPGRTRPSRNSREAPPPVEQWVI